MTVLISRDFSADGWDANWVTSAIEPPIANGQAGFTQSNAHFAHTVDVYDGVDVLVRVNPSGSLGSSHNFYVAYRWTESMLPHSTSNTHALYVRYTSSGANLVRRQNGTDSNLLSVPTGDRWLRCQLEGNTIRFKSWAWNAEEPAGWDYTGTTSASGLVQPLVRVYRSNTTGNSTSYLRSIQVSSLAPAVTNAEFITDPATADALAQVATVAAGTDTFNSMQPAEAAALVVAPMASQTRSPELTGGPGLASASAPAPAVTAQRKVNVLATPATAAATHVAATAAGTNGATNTLRWQTDYGSYGGSALVLGRDAANRVVNLIEFDDVNIAQGSTVTAAHLEFTASSARVGTGTAVVEVYARSTIPAPDMSTEGGTGVFSERTTAGVNWTLPSPATNNSFSTPDIAAVIQEQVSKPAWTSGERLVFAVNYVSGAASNYIDAYGYSSMHRPRLVATFTAPTGQQQTVAVALADAQAVMPAVATEGGHVVNPPRLDATALARPATVQADRERIVGAGVALADAQGRPAALVIQSETDLEYGVNPVEAGAYTPAPNVVIGKNGGFEAGYAEAYTSTVEDPTVDFQTDRVLHALAADAAGRTPGLMYKSDTDPWVLRQNLLQPWKRIEVSQDTGVRVLRPDQQGNTGYVLSTLPKESVGLPAIGNRPALLPDVPISMGNAPEQPVRDPNYGGMVYQGAFELVFRTTRTNVTLARSNQGVLWIDENGFLRLPGTTSSTLAKVNDGQWHYLAVDAYQTQVYDPDAVSSGFTARYFVYLDGKLNSLRRSYLPTWSQGFFPTQFGGTGIQVQTGAVHQRLLYADDARLSQPMLSPHDIEQNWHAVQGIIPIPVGVARASAQAFNTRTRGNQKRALVLFYRLGDGALSGGNSGLAAGDYQYPETGPYIPHWTGISLPARPPGAPLHSRQTVDWGDYKLHWQQIQRDSQGNSPLRDEFTDAWRFIDLSNPDEIDVTEYDLIILQDPPTPQNWNIAADSSFEAEQRAVEQKRYNDFIKGLRGAIDRGVPMWVCQPWIAISLGLMTEYKRIDWHRSNPDIWAYNNVEAFPNGYADNTQNSGRVGFFGWFAGEIKPNPYTYRNNHYLQKYRIVNELPGLTDIPGVSIKEAIGYLDLQDQFCRGSYGAADFQQHPDGYKVGDEIPIHNTVWEHDHDTGRNGDLIRFRHVYLHGAPSADSVVGTPVAQGQLSYVDGAVAPDSKVPNPHKDMVLTFAVERGTVVDGKPIGARVFVDFASDTPGRSNFWHNKTPMRPVDIPNFGPVGFPSPHDDDMRRSREQVHDIIFVDYSYAAGPQNVVTPQISYSYVHPTALYGEHVPMLARGLNWMQQEPEGLPEGYAQHKAVRTLATARAVAPTVTADRSVTVHAELAQAFARTVNPNGITEPDVTVFVSAARATARALAPTRIVFVGPALADAAVWEAFTEVEGEGVVFTLRVWEPEFTLSRGGL